MHVVLQAKSWDIQWVDAEPGQFGIFAAALAHPPCSWEATGSTPFLMLLCRGTAQDTGVWVHVGFPSSHFTGEGRGCFWVAASLLQPGSAAGRDVRRCGTALLPVLPSHSRNVSCFLCSRPCQS